MKRDLLTVGILWLLATAAGEILARANIYPLARSDKGAEIEQAFRTLLMFAVPVFTLVVVTLLYTVLRYRTAGPPEADGPAFFGRGAVPFAWLGVTSSLAVLLMIYPGLTSLPRIVSDYSHPDLVVQVQGMQWAWAVTYPQYHVTSHRELVLPVDRKVRFDITSTDVIHSFWIPAFLMRIDAVPGMTTTVSLRPTRIGSYAQDPNLRLQCSQLCGLGHAVMMMPVRVVSGSDFDAWIQQQQKASGTNVASTTPALALGQSTGGKGR